MRTITRDKLGIRNKVSTRNRIVTVSTAYLLMTAAVAAQQLPGAKPFPGGKPVEMTVMFGAGSAADVTARYLADGMARLLNVPVPVVNRTGGGGAIGYSYVKQQKPDGHSIIWNSNSISTTYHSGTLPFDYKAFDAVARVSVENAGDRSARGLAVEDAGRVDRARQSQSRQGAHRQFRHRQPYPLLIVALFAVGGAKVIDVPFGEGQAMVNLLGSRIEGVVQLPAALVSHVKSGDLRVLAVLGSQRDAVFRRCRRRASSATRSHSTCGGASRCEGRSQARHRQARGLDQAYGRGTAVQGRRQGDRVHARVPAVGGVRQADRQRRFAPGASDGRSRPEEEQIDARADNRATFATGRGRERVTLAAAGNEGRKAWHGQE